MTTLALIGTGLMGFPMVERFLGGGFAVRVFNRTREKAEPLAAKGAWVAASPAEAVEGAQAVVVMVSNAEAVRETLFEGGTRPNLRGRTVIQMSTIGPRESVDLCERVGAAGGDYLEAPVMGTIAQVKSATLIVMVGGRPEQLDRWRPVLTCVCPEPVFAGAVGKAAALKLALNQMLAGHMATFALSLGFIERQGVDREIFMKALRESALYARMFDNKLPRLLARDYSNPNFPVKHLLKDINLFLAAAQESPGLGLATIEGIRKLIEQAMARGLGEGDYSGFSEVVRPEPNT